MALGFLESWGFSTEKVEPKIRGNNKLYILYKYIISNLFETGKGPHIYVKSATT